MATRAESGGRDQEMMWLELLISRLDLMRHPCGDAQQPDRAAVSEASADKFCSKAQEETGASREESRHKRNHPGGSSRSEGQKGRRVNAAHGRDKEGAGRERGRAGWLRPRKGRRNGVQAPRT